MKQIILSILAIFGFAAGSAHAQDDGPLPFGVTVAGKAATHKKGEPFAKITEPVAADGAIELAAKGDLIIINVHKAGADGKPDNAAPGAIILLQKTNKGALDKTVDGKKLAPGKYFLSAVAEGKTATVEFTVK
jgi:hypothetical protein